MKNSCSFFLSLILILSFGITDLHAQEANEVRGVVTDGETGDSLPGVNVVVEGTTTGTATNADGEYELTVPSLNETLIFSFVGYQRVEIPIDGRNEINVELEPQVHVGDELVVVGYGTTARENLTGSVSNVDMSELGSRPLTSTSAALQGQMPGVHALQTSGRAGGDGATIRIRGVGTLNNSDPLVIIDGIPGNIDDVNPADIESLSVLKDAASASIYGSRAANGVILISTRSGDTDGLEVSYSGQVSSQTATAQPDMLSAIEYATMHNEASMNSGSQPMFSEEDIEAIRQGSDPLLPDINYRDVYYRERSPMHDHNLNVTGGQENLQYALMLGYREQQGILTGNQHDRVNFRSNVDASFMDDDRLRLSARLSGNTGTTVNPYNDGGARWHSNLAPVIPLTNADGEWAAVYGEDNYYAEIVEGATTEQFRRVYGGQIGAELDLYAGLSGEIRYGYDMTHTRTNSFRANVPLDNLDGTSQMVPSSLNENNWEEEHTMFNALLRYHEFHGGRHEVNALAGYQQEEFYTHSASAFRRNFVNNTQRVISMGDPSTQSTGGGASELAMQSFFGRIGYVFDDKYMVEGNIRQDASSRFAEGNRVGVFPSFSAGWNIHRENFMPDDTWLGFLKLRASWGQLGNENIFSRYAATQILNTGQNYVLGGSNLQSGVAMTSLANEDVTWETTTQMNVGVDMTLFDNFSLTADFFHRDTENILMQIPIPITMGALSAPFQNVGGVSNTGFEFSGEYSNQFDNGISLSTRLNLSHIRNEVTNLHGRSPIISGSTVLMEGHPIHSFYGYKVEGLYQIEDFTWQNNSDTNIPHHDRNYELRDGVVDVQNFTPQPGDVKYADLSGDGIVTMDNDRTVIGSQHPDLSYSLQINTAWRGVDLGVFLQGEYGVDGYVYGNVTHSFPNFFNMGSWWTDRWTPDNPNTDVKAVTHIDSKKSIHSEYYLEDASYLRIKSIEIGYTLPEVFVEGVGISSLRLFGSVQNAFTFTSFRGFDPERPTWDTSPDAYPQVRILNAGVNLTF